MKGGRSKADTSRKADAKLSVKRKAAEKVTKKPVKKAKAVKDPNKPKRPPSAFFIFMEEFRKQFKEKNPNNKQVSVVGKAAGDKWKSLSAAEKAPYEAKAAKRKADYNKTMVAYNKNLSDGGGKKAVEEEEEEESDKSKSEVHDDDDDEESGEEEDEDDDDE
ncbi:HMG1/2-like protein [Asparagus officinalis]|uniref:HMG1/2-like protein n=1 Tax=Asparagus officinalis TaxID=4686 RepID=UPI00098E7D84|nr:HMG1/2-like protein [Asparagus officinalis]